MKIELDLLKNAIYEAETHRYYPALILDGRSVSLSMQLMTEHAMNWANRHNLKRFAVIVILGMVIGCQQPVGGQRVALLDSNRPPRLYNGGSPSVFANQENGPTIFSKIPGLNNLSTASTNGRSPFPSFGNSNRNAPEPNFSSPLVEASQQQLNDLNDRLRQFDRDNQQLLMEIAGLKQRLQAAGEYNFQLKQQLTDSIGQLQLIQGQKQNLEQQIASLRGQPGIPMTAAAGPNQPPAQPLGGAVLRANNSLMQKLPAINIPGASARMDGDVIRIEIPSDRLFLPERFDINPQAMGTLQSLGDTIRREFPQQIVGIEGHWDGSQLGGGITAHQLTSTQSLAAMQTLARYGLPERQLFTMALGNNRPRHAGGLIDGISPNRRIEIVIYPETYDSR